MPTDRIEEPPEPNGVPQEPEIVTPIQMLLKRIDERLSNLEDFIFSEKKGQEGIAIRLKVIDEWAGATQQKFKTTIDPLLERLASGGVGVVSPPTPSAVSTGDKEFDRLQTLMQFGDRILNGQRGPSPLDKLKDDIFVRTLTNSMNLTEIMVQSAQSALLKNMGIGTATEMNPKVILKS